MGHNISDLIIYIDVSVHKDEFINSFKNNLNYSSVKNNLTEF